MKNNYVTIKLVINMKIEKWNYKGEEIEIPILEGDEIERNLDIESKLESTQDLTEDLKNIGDINE